MRTAHQSPLFSLPGLAIECSSLSLPAWKAVTVVSLPGQRIIARMLTGWDAAAFFRASSFHDVSLARYRRLLLPRRPELGFGFPPVLSLPAGKAVSRGARKSPVFLASFSFPFKPKPGLLTLLVRMQWYFGYGSSPCLFSPLRRSTCYRCSSSFVSCRVPRGSLSALMWWFLRWFQEEGGAPRGRPHAGNTIEVAGNFISTVSSRARFPVAQ